MRTYPVTFLHDRTEQRREREWHLLVYAMRGHLEVIAGGIRRIVPVDRAVLVPADTEHTAVMRAPIAMRSLFLAAGAMPHRGFERIRTITVAPLLRELVLHVTRIGALDRGVPGQQRLVGVLLDLLAAADDVQLELPSPRDARARRFADLITREPGDDRSIAKLARACGASQRTIERTFVAETGMAVGEWRRRVRLFHALRLLETGSPVTSVAFDVGYSTVSAFSQAFARQFGFPPSRRRS